MTRNDQPEYITAEEFGNRVTEIGERYDARIRNQIASINRIMAGGKYDDEMAALHEQLAEATAEVTRLQRDNELLRQANA